MANHNIHTGNISTVTWRATLPIAASQSNSSSYDEWGDPVPGITIPNTKNVNVGIGFPVISVPGVRVWLSSISYGGGIPWPPPGDGVHDVTLNMTVDVYGMYQPGQSEEHYYGDYEIDTGARVEVLTSEPYIHASFDVSATLEIEIAVDYEEIVSIVGGVISYEQKRKGMPRVTITASNTTAVGNSASGSFDGVLTGDWYREIPYLEDEYFPGGLPSTNPNENPATMWCSTLAYGSGYDGCYGGAFFAGTGMSLNGVVSGSDSSSITVTRNGDPVPLPGLSAAIPTPPSGGAGAVGTSGNVISTAIQVPASAAHQNQRNEPNSGGAQVFVSVEEWPRSVTIVPQVLDSAGDVITGDVTGTYTYNSVQHDLPGGATENFLGKFTVGTMFPPPGGSAGAPLANLIVCDSEGVETEHAAVITSPSENPPDIVYVQYQSYYTTDYYHSGYRVLDPRPYTEPLVSFTIPNVSQRVAPFCYDPDDTPVDVISFTGNPDDPAYDQTSHGANEADGGPAYIEAYCPPVDIGAVRSRYLKVTCTCDDPDATVRYYPLCWDAGETYPYWNLNPNGETIIDLLSPTVAAGKVFQCSGDLPPGWFYTYSPSPTPNPNARIYNLSAGKTWRLTTLQAVNRSLEVAPYAGGLVWFYNGILAVRQYDYPIGVAPWPIQQSTLLALRDDMDTGGSWEWLFASVAGLVPDDVDPLDRLTEPPATVVYPASYRHTLANLGPNNLTRGRTSGALSARLHSTISGLMGHRSNLSGWNALTFTMTSVYGTAIGGNSFWKRRISQGLVQTSFSDPVLGASLLTGQSYISAPHSSGAVDVSIAAFPGLTHHSVDNGSEYRSAWLFRVDDSVTPPPPSPDPPPAIDDEVDEPYLPPDEPDDPGDPPDEPIPDDSLTAPSFYAEYILTEDTMYRKIISALSYTGAALRETCRRVADNMYPGAFRVDEDSYVWRADISAPVDRELLVTVTFQEETVVPRRASSLADFFRATDPVWYPANIIEAQDGSAIHGRTYVYMRNLEVTERYITANGGSVLFSVSGVYDDSWLAYELPERSRLTIPAQFHWAVVPNRGIVERPDGYYATIPFARTLRVRYRDSQKIEDIASGGIVTAGNLTRPVARLHLRNGLDELAYLRSITRISVSETNKALLSRVLAAGVLPGGADREAVSLQIANALGLVSTVDWTVTDSDTPDVLTLDPAADFVHIPGLDRTNTVSEELREIADGGVVFFAGSRKNWDADYRFVINGMRIDEPELSGLTVDTLAGTVTGPAASDKVVAVYTSRNYAVTSDAGGRITALASTAGATPPGIYQVIVLRSVTAGSAGDPDYQKAMLYRADGTPTSLLRAIAASMAASVPLVIGAARWGAAAVWFEDDDPTPVVDYMPLPMR